MEDKTQALVSEICDNQTTDTGGKIAALHALLEIIKTPRELPGNHSNFRTYFGPLPLPDPAKYSSSFFNAHPEQPYANALGFIKEAVLALMGKAAMGSLDSEAIDNAREILAAEKTAFQPQNHK